MDAVQFFGLRAKPGIQEDPFSAVRKLSALVRSRATTTTPAAATFDSVYESYHGRVYRVILRLVQNPSDAEDLTQETFLKVQSNLLHVKRPESVPSWLYRIATNTALDFLRKSASRRPKDTVQLPMEKAEAVPSDVRSPSAALDATVSVSCVRGNADQLPEQYRLVLVLHDLEGVDLEQVAEVMGSSIGATKVRLHRARKRFAEICRAECEQFYNEEGTLFCQPRSTIAVISAEDSCCGLDSPNDSCA